MERAPALTEGLRILELVSTRKDPVLFETLVAELRMSRSSVNRLLKVLADSGYLHVFEGRRGYGPGPRLLNTAAQCLEGRNVIHQIQDALQQTAVDLQMAVQYGMLDRARQRIVVLCHADVEGAVKVGPPGCDISPMANRHALGKVILAKVEREVYRALIKQLDEERKTQNTILPGPKLDHTLMTIRREGVAIDREELRPGLFRVAVPVCGERLADLGAVCASCFAQCFSSRQADIIAERLQSTARTIEMLLMAKAGS